MKPSAFLSELENIRLRLEDEKGHLEEDYYEYPGFYPGIDPEVTTAAFHGAIGTHLYLPVTMLSVMA